MIAHKVNIKMYTKPVGKNLPEVQNVLNCNSQEHTIGEHIASQPQLKLTSVQSEQIRQTEQIILQ